MWWSCIQRECALSTTEAEYIALFESLREVISAMQLLTESNKSLGWEVTKRVPVVQGV